MSSAAEKAFASSSAGGIGRGSGVVALDGSSATIDAGRQ
jgi:hypothetical protein